MLQSESDASSTYDGGWNGKFLPGRASSDTEQGRMEALALVTAVEEEEEEEEKEAVFLRGGKKDPPNVHQAQHQTKLQFDECVASVHP